MLNAALNVKGALALLYWPTIASVAVSNMVNPAMNRDPSGDMDSTEDCPATVRLRRMTPEATSYTKRYVEASVGVMTPTINCPSGVRISLPAKVVTGRVKTVGGKGAGVVGKAGTS